MTDRKGRTLGTILGFFRVIYGLIWFAAGAGFLMTILMPFSSSIKDDFCRIPINFMLRSADIGFFVSGSIHATVLARSTGWLVRGYDLPTATRVAMSARRPGPGS